MTPESINWWPLRYQDLHATGLEQFLQSLQAQGQLNTAVMFSASDFGRALSSNGDGCDDGWGRGQTP